MKGPTQAKLCCRLLVWLGTGNWSNGCWKKVGHQWRRRMWMATVWTVIALDRKSGCLLVRGCFQQGGVFGITASSLAVFVFCSAVWHCGVWDVVGRLRKTRRFLVP
eukprot:TRINITY_DN66838_c6_g3_i7.p1 TRINITY_DN66838_c6_g3~~TRINITY_DN66838_c6_g3_i7.p1  ORF type:complete len:106 (+),score=4.81 TRINITY_DN66838_c6_g3_i7:125-442(+)